MQRCQVLLVAGEAGMGKTSLVAEAARAVHAEGAVVLFGHADEDLGVAVSAVDRDRRAPGAPRRRGGARGVAVGPARRVGVRLVPEIGTDGDRVADPDTERLLLLEGTTELVVAQSQISPVLLVLDDLHWADTASLQLLRHLIASSTPMNVTVACTYRYGSWPGDPLNLLLSDLHREANVTRVGLKGLEDTDVVVLLVAVAGHDLDDDGVGLADAVRRETDGNPFFTRELLRHLGETGGVVLGEDGRWVARRELEEIGLPSSVRDVVGRRVARLGDEAARVLTLAVVIGLEFDLDLLTELADIDEIDSSISWTRQLPLRSSSRAATPTGTASATRSSNIPFTRNSARHAASAPTSASPKPSNSACRPRRGDARGTRTPLGRRHPSERRGQGPRLRAPCWRRSERRARSR